MEPPDPTMRIPRLVPPLLAGLLLVGVSACGDDASGPERTRISLLLTDAPGNVVNFWVDFASSLLVTESGAEFVIFESSGVINVAALGDGEAATLADEVSVTSGLYHDLRLVFNGAAVEAEEGEIFTYGDIALPGGRTATGALECPACDVGAGTISTLVPRIGTSGIALRGEAALFVLDFDLPRSLVPPPPGGTDWTLNPRVQVSLLDQSFSVVGDVLLSEGVSVPECPAGVARDIGSFVPLARSVTFSDRGGNDILRSGDARSDPNTFAIRFLQVDGYDLEHVEEVVVSDDRRLVFEAFASPARVIPEAAGEELEAQYTVESVTCEPR